MTAATSPGAVLFSLLAAVFFSGCASPTMKGTPFYSGEYETRKGPAENRVNLWPLLYYRDPALSILWPIGEKTDDHFALRPVMSVYGLNEDERVYNVLWPLAQFDRKTGDSRIVPMFWGNDYAALFPLYWHGGHPLSAEGGYDTLFPLWYFSRDSGGYNSYWAGPLIHFRERDRESGWHIWPFAGSYTDADGFYRFQLWPLMHQWSDAKGAGGGSAMLPLYYYARAASGAKTLMTPLYSSGAGPSTGEGWSLLLPAYYERHSADGLLRATLLGGYRKTADELFWGVVPLLSGGRSGKTSGSMWLGGPLAHFRWDGNSRSEHVFPLYYRSVDPWGSLFLSLPWSSGTDADGASWRLVPPLVYRSRDRNGESLITPLYARGIAQSGRVNWDALLPVYFRRHSGDTRLTATLLGGWRTDPNGSSWLIYPLLSWSQKDENGRDLWIAAPFFHHRTDATSVTSHLLPLYYWNGEDRTFLSLLAARWETEAGRRALLVPPILSLATYGPGATNIWALGGLAHFGWGEKAESSYVVPLYYRNREGTVVSPVLAAWKNDGGRTWICPPLLSGFSKNRDVRQINALLGLWHEEWGGKEREGFLIPLYLYRGTTEFYTPILGWNRGGASGYIYPLTPLLGFRTGDTQGGWLFPLMSYKRKRGSSDYSGTFLWGGYEKKGNEYHSGFVPFYGYRNSGPPPATAPQAGGYARQGKEFWSLPAYWYRNQEQLRPEGQAFERNITNRMVKVSVRENGLFPLWSYSKEFVPARNTLNVDRSLLLLLHDYKREVKPSADSPGGITDYTRSRILWRLYHYERLNGDVSADVFPAITYDTKTDGFKRVSFLWRFFRYERDKDGTKLDLLFLPLVR